MKKMGWIKTVGLVASCLCLAVLPMQAQLADEYRYETVTLGITAATNGQTVATASTNGIINLTDMEQVALQLFSRSMTNETTTSNTVFSICYGPNTTDWDTNRMLNISLPCKGTNLVNILTNLNVGAYGYAKIWGIQNADTNWPAYTPVTNMAVRVLKKPIRYGYKFGR